MGLQLAAVRDFTVNSGGIFHYYGLDGHGSVRFLTDATGAVTYTYDYDAFGNLIASTGTTVNNYLFAGEQFDPALGIYYNRARYYDQRQGRFWSMDTYEGNERDPLALHKYLYAGADPVNRIDPSGHDFLDVAVAVQFYAISVAQSLGPVAPVLGFAFTTFNVALFITNDQFRNDVIAALGPSEAATLVRADLEMLFEYGGATATAVIRAARGVPTDITLDLFGGEVSQIPGAINIDLRGKPSLSVASLPYADASVSKIVASGPRAPFLKAAARVLKPGGRIYINYTIRNEFGRLPDEGTLNSLRLRPVSVGGPLDAQFASQTFTLSDGTPIPTGSVLTTILENTE